MFTYFEFKAASISERASLIANQAKHERSPEGVAPQLEFPLKASKVINRIIDDYIDDQIKHNLEHLNGPALQECYLKNRINEILSTYQSAAIEKLSKSPLTAEECKTNPANLFELAGAVQLASGNRVSRHISTTMGTLWERIAKISPYVVDPEKDFGTKITGVDIILRNSTSNQIEYAQLKTQKNTLTGSQSSRSDAELNLHDHPVFCACFEINQNWTYNTKKDIPRLAGKEFWDRIGIEYTVVTDSLSDLILSLEDSFIRMLRDG